MDWIMRHWSFLTPRSAASRAADVLHAFALGLACLGMQCVMSQTMASDVESAGGTGAAPAVRTGPPASPSGEEGAAEAPSGEVGPADPDSPSESDGEEPSGWTEQDSQRLDSIREDLRSLLAVQRVLQWYSLTQGEPGMRTETFRGREDLFSQESLLFLERAGEVPDLSDVEKRALVLLRRELARQSLYARVSPFDDRISKAEREPKSRLSWLKEPISYLDLLALLETSPAERSDEIRGELTRVQLETLAPLRAERESMLRALSVQLGFPSYLALAEELRERSLVLTLADAERFLAMSEPLHVRLTQLVQAEVGKGAYSAGELFHGPPTSLDRYFPHKNALDSARLFVRGLGLSLRTVAGTPIQFRALLSGIGEQQAQVIPVRVPRDIRVVISEQSGFSARASLFTAVGQALYFGNLRTSSFELQSVGPSWRSIGLGELARLVWLEPGFLKRYREDVSRTRLRAPWEWTPVMSDEDIRRFVIWEVWQELTRLRRLAWGQLGLDAILHGADAVNALELSSPSPQNAAIQLFSRAQGWAVSEGEARTLVLSTPDLLESLDSVRGSILAHLTLRQLRAQYGNTWFLSREAGSWLLQQIAPGAETDERAAAQALGLEALELSPLLGLLETILQEVGVSMDKDGAAPSSL